MYPEALRMEMKTEYERWLRENSEDVLRLLLGERSMEARERVFFLAGNGLLTPEAADAGALIASGILCPAERWAGRSVRSRTVICSTSGICEESGLTE